jgi:amino acid transporter
LSFAQYAIQPFFSTDCQLPDSALRLLAAVAICFLIALNCFDVSGAAKIQNVFSFAKLTVLAIIIIAGFIALIKGFLFTVQLNYRLYNAP